MIDGRVTTAQAVHHRNHNKSDNRPENLQGLTRSEHGKAHGVIDRRHVAALYQSGMTTIEVAREVGTHPGNISRMLADVGVPARSVFKFTPEEEAQIAAEMAAVGYSAPVRRRLGISRKLASRIANDHGVRLLVGRPRSVAADAAS